MRSTAQPEFPEAAFWAYDPPPTGQENSTSDAIDEGRLLGPLAKKSLIVDGKPMRRNAMTERSCVVTDERDFVVEGQRLRASIDRFAAGGGATRQLVVEHHV